MTARDDLRALIDDLDDDTAAEVLAYARWLLEESTAPALGDLQIRWQAPADQRPRD
jgi:hypothetical protein